MSNAVVEIENVWKIFGSRADEAMQSIRTEGLPKTEVLERYDAVVGVKDATFQLKRVRYSV